MWNRRATGSGHNEAKVSKHLSCDSSEGFTLQMAILASILLQFNFHRDTRALIDPCLRVGQRRSTLAYIAGLAFHSAKVNWLERLAQSRGQLILEFIGSSDSFNEVRQFRGQTIAVPNATQNLYIRQSCQCRMYCVVNAGWITIYHNLHIQNISRHKFPSENTTLI